MTKQSVLMGQIVTVNVQLERHVEHNKRTDVTWQPKQWLTPRAGWVVGFRAVQEGHIEPGGWSHSGWDDEPSEEPSYLSIKRVIPVIMVVFWPTMKPVIVPLDGYVLGGVPVSPARKNYQEFAAHYPKKAEEFVQIMREEARSMQRDERGRFKKIVV